MRLKALVFFIFGFIFSGHTQVVNFKNANNSQKKSYQKALQLYRSDQYEKAKISFEKLIKKYPEFIDAQLMLGSIYFDLKEAQKAEIYFNKVLALDKDYNPKVYYTLSLCNYYTQKYDQAYSNLKEFLSREKINHDLIEKGKKNLITFRFADSATRHPVENISYPLANLNSSNSEYLPSLTADGRTIVFTRKINDYNEDLFISYLNDQNQWETPQPIKDLNTTYNEGAPALTPDGNTLVFVSCDRKESYGGCDLFISHKTENGWSAAANFGNKINSPAYETQPCFADNGRVLLFTSNRVGGYGGRDIWMTLKNANNTWITPFNLGPDINTTGDEECPFLHQDGITLFFSSDGHPGMGKKDIFMSKMKTFTTWTIPQNIGYPINSPLDESSFVAYSNGKKALMASDKSFVGIYKSEDLKKLNLDLYEFDIPNFVQPTLSCFLKFKVVDSKTKNPISANVAIYRVKDKKVFFSDQLNATGIKQISLPGDDEYFINITHPNYYLYSDNFQCNSNGRFNILTQEYNLISAQITEVPIVLKNVLFEVNSADLKEESYFELTKLLSFLKEKKDYNVQIIGHTDNQGSHETNLILSGKRADRVLNYLVQNGIAKERITSIGKGETESVSSNDSERGRSLNRRTEFILKQTK
ncbi:MAG: PD40 domain-containing protein [Saprospiraceae bacterium]|nr:PD40 domain-containing protein [Saprospiraceae bacterium]